MLCSIKQWLYISLLFTLIRSWATVFNSQVKASNSLAANTARSCRKLARLCIKVRVLPTKRRLLLAATRLVVSEQSRGLTLRAVASSAGLSLGMVRHYFGSKAGLIEELERHFDSAHANYMATTEQRTQDFKQLTIKDQESAKTIETQMRRLQRTQDSLAHWKTKLASNQRECEERNRSLKEEKNMISRHFQELKGRMNKFRDVEARRLQELTLHSQKSIKTLKERLGRAERILKLGELTRQLETEREKVLPFYESSVEDEEKAGCKLEEWTELLMMLDV